MNPSYSINKGDVEEVRECPICKSNDILKISEISINKVVEPIVFFETSACKKCNHIFRSKRPKEKWFFDKFEERRKYQDKKSFNPINEKVEIDRFNRYKELGIFLDKKLSQSLRNRKVFDFGCGTGSGLIALNELGFDAVGIEPDLTRANYGLKKDLNILTLPWEKVKEELKSASLILSIHSLEHFYHPVNFIKHIYEHTKQDCYLYLEVPNSSFINDWTDSFYLAHINNFSNHSLIKMLKKQGYFLHSLIPAENIFSNPLNSICGIFSKKKPEIDINFKTNQDLKIDYYNPPISYVEKPYKFIVDVINDLSLTYRIEEKVSSSVTKNQSGRKLKIDNNFICLY